MHTFEEYCETHKDLYKYKTVSLDVPNLPDEFLTLEEMNEAINYVNMVRDKYLRIYFSVNNAGQISLSAERKTTEEERFIFFTEKYDYYKKEQIVISRFNKE